MCGICGWLDVKGQLNTDVIVAMNNIAKYRGPDDEGYVAIGNNTIKSLKGYDSCAPLHCFDDVRNYALESDGDFLLLGHRRLSIIDLSYNGHQPMVDSENNLCIVFNGEIYNYIELREELQKEGYYFLTETDVEVILKAYTRWGESCVDHFNGMWGLAIWDGKSKKLFCSRDRLGAKPFYYSQTDNGFVFASEIKQICQNPNVERVLNESVALNQIVYDISDYSEETLIKAIKELRGGHNLVISLDDNCGSIIGIKNYKYWDIELDVKSEKAIGEAFETLKDAIRIRTRSDAPIGVLLSGGLDSSCIVAEIAEYYKEKGISTRKLRTFTSCYDDFEEGNEQDYAARVNEHCGTTQNFVFPDPQDTLSLFMEMIWHLEGNANYAVLGSYAMLREVSKSGIKVLINGQGSDELQFGYERYYVRYIGDLLKTKGIIESIRSIKEVTSNSKLTMRKFLEYSVYFSFPRIRRLFSIYRMKGCLNRYTIKELKKVDAVRGLRFRNMRDMLYSEIKSTQLTHILRMDDRLYMSSSIESRVPYIDYRYVESAVRIPEERKIENGYTKYLLRKQYEGKLPSEVIWRKNKMGWPSPRTRWASRIDKEKMHELITTARTSRFFNTLKLERCFLRNPSSRCIERFLVLESFVREFDVRLKD